MDIQVKLDEDFVFYLGFMSKFLSDIKDPFIKNRCEAWLEKLCGEKCEGVLRKRCRNVYLSQLLLCMQEGSLSEPFLFTPNSVDIANALDVFKLVPEDEEKPAWLNNSDVTPDLRDKEARDGRTYLATRTLPQGRGAMAYIALSIGDDESVWMGAGEGFDKQMDQKYKSMVRDYEMERILQRRKDPKEREKALNFFSVILNNIADELDEKINSDQNMAVTNLLVQLVQDLRERNEFCKYEHLDEKDCRRELLLLLHDRVHQRVKKMKEREEVLDDVENNVFEKSFFETSVREEDRMKLPATMWEQAINKAPAKKHLDKLHSNYPVQLIETFLELLADYKENIAMRMQRRYENIISQMQKEVRKEGEKGKRNVDIAQQDYDEIMEIYRVVKEAYDRKEEVERKNREALHVSQPEHSKLYDQMRDAIFDTQKGVEEESARGKMLAAEINMVNEQTELAKEINDDHIKKIEEANMVIIKNIKRLNLAIKQHQDRIGQLQKQRASGTGGQQFVSFM